MTKLKYVRNSLEHSNYCKFKEMTQFLNQFLKLSLTYVLTNEFEQSYHCPSALCVPNAIQQAERSTNCL